MEVKTNMILGREKEMKITSELEKDAFDYSEIFDCGKFPTPAECNISENHPIRW